MTEKETRDLNVEDRPDAPPETSTESQSSALVTTRGSNKGPLRRLPWYTSTLMMTHLAFSRDTKQHSRWAEQVEGLRMVETLPRIKHQPTRALLRKPEVWRRVRRVGVAGASLSLATSAPWFVWLLPVYALGHGFGWLAALAFMLPVPIAWTVARRLYEDAAIGNITDTDKSRSLFPKASRAIKSGARTFAAGYGFGFTLLFLQGIITYFMTPAPTLMMEIFLDLFYASVAGLMSGTAAMLFMAPLVSMTGRKALPEGVPTRTPQLEA